jgi:hypothetical protein
MYREQNIDFGLVYMLYFLYVQYPLRVLTQIAWLQYFWTIRKSLTEQTFESDAQPTAAFMESAVLHPAILLVLLKNP